VSERTDRTIYDIRSSPDLAGSNTLDVLKFLPGVSIGPSEDVTIRGGAHVSYLIDGKTARREVAIAIPAGEIERIEVIPNPSAEYDSDSEALINLILKHNASAGWRATASLAGDTLGGGKGGVTVSHGGEDWNINGSLTARSAPLITLTDRKSVFFPTSANSGASTQDLKTRDDKTTNKNSLQFKASRNSRDGNSISLMVGTTVNIVPQSQKMLQKDTFKGYSNTVNLGRRILFIGYYPYFDLSSDTKIDDAWSLSVAVPGNLGYTNASRRTYLNLNQNVFENTDFSDLHPSITIKRNTGSGHFELINGYSYNPVKDILSYENPSSSNGQKTQAYNYKFSRGVYSSVFLYDGNVFGFSLKPALRFEAMAQKFSNYGVKFKGISSLMYILPSISILRKIGDDDSLKIGITERTNRPDALQLNPYVNIISPYYVQKGNPFLKPARETEYELNYIHSHNNNSISNSIFLRNKKHDISQFLTTDTNGVTTITYTNAGTSVTFGYSGTFKGKIGNNLDINLGVDVYHTAISGPIGAQNYGTVNFTSFNLNASAIYDLKKYGTISSQISYTGKSYDLSIETPRYYTSQIEYKLKVIGEMQATLLLSDIFIPLDSNALFTGFGVNGSESTRRNSRLFRFGLATKF